MKFLIPSFISLAVLFVCTTSAQSAEQFNVVVIGGTPGGIAAALSAGRAGHSVLLVEEQLHLGGMMTSGLGKSDVEKR
ncbi:MAG: FAD-dependent oxidoreductase, partial [Planctomycetaceae bacterium]|nr:FAD-dependent oxidoreductase [Planctomycetaceae bacterium]